jgi:hypothetical protein
MLVRVGSSGRSVAEAYDRKMLLYKRTTAKSAPGILAEGLSNSIYNSEPEMERGVWFSEDPDDWAPGNPALFAIDVPEDRVSEIWRSKYNPVEWQIPSRYIRDLQIEVFEDGT